MQHRVIASFALVAALALSAACADSAADGSADEPAGAASPAPTARPEPADQPSPAPADAKDDIPLPPPPPPLAIERMPPSPLQVGWVTLTEHDDAKQHAWIEGEVVNGDEFTINTSNVRRFTLDLTRVRLNWSKRIVLRMDGFNSQLTKKRWPRLNFVRTPAGAWDVEAD